MENQTSFFDALLYGFRATISHMRVIFWTFFTLFPLLLMVAAVFIILMIFYQMSQAYFYEYIQVISQLPKCKGENCIELVKSLPAVFIPAFFAASSFMLAIAILSISFNKAALDIIDYNESSVATVFRFAYSLRGLKYLISMILYFLIILGGVILFIIPGIIWLLRFGYFGFFIIDKNAGIIESLKLSFRATKGYTWQLFGLFLVQEIITIAGLSGLIIIPIYALTGACIYRKIFMQ